tara:strand:+ start:826 stop:981 length:156 start_codon:yes stop_codon:yes gene_type:complete
MLEVAAIIFLILTSPIWVPILWGLIVSLLSFGFVALFWIIFVIAILYLIFA